MTYDTWKTTEPEHRVGFICDGCALMFPEPDMQWRGGTCFCPRCAEVTGWHKPQPTQSKLIRWPPNATCPMMGAECMKYG